ncbi:uncharacterized protein LOC117317157 [Pecten maximus]|uniref:uncharacterized protein LOC117317157 n=1 Tax=Pecten maximus TaxID=6579 RepID=UPI0014590050|nr:uncharacterized protein LOC117317157 [Pecten maximus]
MDNIHNNGSLTTEQNSLSLLQSIMVWTLCSVSVIAFTEHFVILLLTCVNKTLRQKPYIVSILLLSSSDILLSFALFLFSLITLVPLQQTWICGFAYFLIQLGFVTSLVHTLIICTERYLCSRPIPIEALSLRKRQALTLINMGICSLILGIPYLFAVKEPMVKTCVVLSIFRDNLPYALVPVRSITFLIWISTIVIYVITAKNFRNAVRRTGRLECSYCDVENRDTKDVKSADNIQSDSDASRQSGSMTGLTSNRDQSSTEIEKQKRNSKDEVKVRDAFTKQSEEKTVISTSSFEPESNIQTDRKNDNRAAHAHFMVVKAEGAKTENKTIEDNININEIETFQASLDNAAGYMSDKSANACTCACSVRFPRRKHSKSYSQVPTEAFRTVSVVFVVFLISMTPQSVVGPIMIAFPMSETVEFGCAILAISSILTNPFMFAFLLKDFRRVVMGCK